MRPLGDRIMILSRSGRGCLHRQSAQDANRRRQGPGMKRDGAAVDRSPAQPASPAPSTIADAAPIVRAMSASPPDDDRMPTIGARDLRLETPWVRVVDKEIVPPGSGATERYLVVEVSD